MSASERLAAAGLALVLVVLFASAAIRLGPEAAPPIDAFSIGAIRVLHRAAASLEVLAMLALGWIAWRTRVALPALARGAAVAAAITVFLSVLGIAAGQSPPPATALGNLLGGLALGASFAWLLGRGQRRNSGRGSRIAHGAAALLVVQCVLGAWISIFAQDLWTAPLFLHLFFGVALAGGAAWLGLRCERAAHRCGLLGLALAVPAAGFAAALFAPSLAAALAHAAAVALLVAAAAYAHARLA